MHTSKTRKLCVCVIFHKENVFWSPEEEEEEQKARTSHSFIYLAGSD